jgi:hypothetical protein
MFGVASEGAWSVYAAQAQLWAAAPEAILMVVANLALARAIVRTGASTSGPLIASFAWAAVLVATTLFGGWSTLGVLLGLAYAVQAAPSIWSVYRVRVPTGIAPGRWMATVAESSLWVTYGTAHRDRAVALYGLLALIVAVAILVRWTATHVASERDQRVLAQRHV